MTTHDSLALRRFGFCLACIAFDLLRQASRGSPMAKSAHKCGRDIHDGAIEERHDG